MKPKTAFGICFLLVCLLANVARFGEASEDDNAPQDRPNILFAISDDQSWIHTSASGCKSISTPNFDRVAREGILFSCRERHSSSRWNNLTYPQRCIRTPTHLLIRNFKPERWPAGAPQKFASKDKLGPEDGGYHDIDACPSLSYLIKNKSDPGIAEFLSLSVDARPAIELYDITKDPGCLQNLSGDPNHLAIESKLETQLNEYLKSTGDPRLNGDGDVWEKYIRYSRMRSFPKPQWAQSSEK